MGLGAKLEQLLRKAAPGHEEEIIRGDGADARPAHQGGDGRLRQGEGRGGAKEIFKQRAAQALEALRQGWANLLEERARPT
jgi:hypothetical protein